MKILAGNWKLHKTQAETRDFFSQIDTPQNAPSVRKIIAASPTLMATAVISGTPLGFEIFSQNVAWETSGAWTGEISPAQLRDIGVRGTLVGHSERRQFFGDTDESCKRRAACAQLHGLDVIYCIGESLDDRKAGKTHEVLKRQLQPVLELRPTSTQSFILAYEPVWAIGTGVVAEIAQIKEAHAWISEILTQNELPAFSVLYGGSVKPNNFKEISSIERVDGGLVGGASLEAKSFLELQRCL